MITAQEARQITMAANRMKRLEDMIRNQAKAGEFELVPGIRIDDDDAKYLQSIGFKVKTREVIDSGFHGGVGDDPPSSRMETYIAWSAGL